MTAKKKKAQGNTASTQKEAASSSLPFEPVRQKQPQPTTAASAKPSPSNQPTMAKGKQSLKGMPSNSNIPEVVNRRMVKRAAFFCGLPTACAILTFVVSYFAIANDLFKPPTVAVLLVSLGFFGLGVLGLSYGPLSASWDEERLGNALGFDEFKLNFGRLRESWRTAKAANDNSSD
ncbi:MAG: PAM68 family protein [Stenomitos rutilans HA7619-LM2]|jgi:hypothetical protein|nr:PAM68 family protein [Stenomitos rutilans HA7619-LM2]